MPHTPGTWRTLESPHSKDIAILTSQGMIAEVFHRIDDETFADVESNARLIAAAPSLVEALKKIEKMGRDVRRNSKAEFMGNIARQALDQAGE